MFNCKVKELNTFTNYNFLNFISLKPGIAELGYFKLLILLKYIQLIISEVAQILNLDS